MDKKYLKDEREKIKKPLKKPKKKQLKEIFVMKKKCPKGKKVCNCK
tara:strand:+ start:14692 stop:14829 length:138 start_codon:yes stop_codon:yes gene_type:complete